MASSAIATNEGHNTVRVRKDRARFLAGGVSGVLVAVLFNPLDVIKTRMQAEAAATAGKPKSCSGPPSIYALRNPGGQLTFPGLAGCCCDPGEAFYVAPRQCVYPPSPTPSSSSMWRTGLDILSKERASALWRGVDSALMVSVPMIGLYLPLYDSLLAYASPTLGVSYGAMLSGVVARGAVSFLVAPLELVRTKQQAVTGPCPPPSASRQPRPMSTFSALRDIVADGGGSSAGFKRPGLAAADSAATSAMSRATGVAAGGAVMAGGASGAVVASPHAISPQPFSQGWTAGPGPAYHLVRNLPRLWTGFLATLARDVPFSAFYWGMLETMRISLLASAVASKAAAHSPQGCVPLAAPQPLSKDRLVGGAVMREAAAGTVPVWTLGHQGSSAPTTTSMLGTSTSQSAAGLPRGFGNSSDKSRGSSSWAIPQQQQQQAVARSSAALAAGLGQWDVVRVNMLAGSVSGGIAAAVTTPFDVIKTQLQLVDLKAHRRQGAWTLVKQVWHKQGIRGFFTGAAPRAARAAPACAIVVSCYEGLKVWLG